MIILSASHLSKVYGTDVILKDVDFHINAGDRIGIVGRNGAGKTTLLNMLTGELAIDDGDVFISQNTVVGYLKQRDNFSPEDTVFSAIDNIFQELHRMEKEMARLSDEIAQNPKEERLLISLDNIQQEYARKGGYTYKSEITGILSSMAFGEDSFEKKIETLSGGERTRLALAALLLEKPDILMLDEPTNHLDIGTLRWLEQYLSSYKGTIIMVSHDRYFLDKTVNRIFEVENHKVYCYEGNYSTYASQKHTIRESQLRAYQNQQKEIARQEDMIRKMKQRGTEKLAKRAQSREKRLDQIERLERPEALEGKLKINFKQNFPSGNDVIITKDLEKQYRRTLFKGVDLDIKRGEKICIVGANGVGKTTLLKILLGQLSPTGGYLKIGHNVDFGYYDQGQLLLNKANTVLEELKESYRLYTDTEMRSILGRFLFKGEEVFLNVGSLSGGEKARLSLLKLMLSGSNTLILDEPTNHLDIESKEVFEEALMEFPGTAIIVSHDRYFLQKIPNRILELTEDGIVEYLGKYDYYQEKKAQVRSGKKYLASLSETQEGSKNSKTSETQEAGLRGVNAANGFGREESAKEQAFSSEEQRKLNKMLEAEERRKKRKLEKLEEEIALLEEELKKIEEEMTNEEIMADYQKLDAVSKKHREIEEKLEEAYENWSNLSE